MMRTCSLMGLAIATLLMAGVVSAEDDPPVEYVEQTVTFGFHNRGAEHWAGPIEAACAGLTGLQNPLNDRTAPAEQGPDLRVVVDGLRIPWHFPSDAAYHVMVTEMRDVRGPIKLLLFDKHDSEIRVNGKRVELTKAGDSYNAADNNGIGVARVQAEAETKASGKGNAGGHVVLTVKVRPHVDFTLSANPASDSTSVAVQVRVFPATGTLIKIDKFTIRREREQWQNAMGQTTSTIEQVDPDDLTRWRIPAAYWYGDPATGDLCYDFVAPYRVTLLAPYRLEPDGPVHHGQAQRTLGVRLPQYPGWMRAAHLAAFPKVIANTPPFQGADGKWSSTLTIPDDIFGKKGNPVNADQSQYRPLITLEEEYHVKQWMGQVPREKGGCGDLFTRNAVEYYLENAQPDYDGQTIIVADTRIELLMKIHTRRVTAVDKARKESLKLWQLRGGYIEKQAKQVVGFKEAYTYACTYQADWGENPANPNAPWKE